MTRGVCWREELTIRSPRKTKSDDELDFGAEMGMVGICCRRILWEIFENQDVRGRRGARSGKSGSSWFGVRREIRRRMPSGDTRFIKAIQTIEWTK